MLPTFELRLYPDQRHQARALPGLRALLDDRFGHWRYRLFAGGYAGNCVAMTRLERELQASVAYFDESERQKVNQMSNAIQLHSVTGEVSTYQPVELSFTEEQEEMIRQNFSTGATESEFQVLMAVAKARRLNPLLRQVHFVKRWDKQRNDGRGGWAWAVQVSIDGLRAIAERTRLYDGQDEPEFEHDERGRITLARVRVYKKGIARAFVGVARWNEYVQTTKEGNPSRFWKDMPYTMLGKCAEALAIRKAFPEDSGGLMVQEEMMQAESGRELPIEQQPPRISPHGSDADLTDRERDALVDPEELMELLVSAQTMLANGMWAAARKRIGAKGGDPGEFGPKFSAAKLSGKLSADYSKALGKLWGQLDRQIAKLEKAELEKPADVLATMTDPEDDPEDFDRTQ